MSQRLSFKDISKARRLLALGALAFCVWPLPLSADDISIPPIGQTATYSCRGSYGGEYRYTVEAVEEGVVRYRLKARSYSRELTMPIWLLGTSLYVKDQGSGYGSGKITEGLEAFSGLRSLTVGAEFSGDVREVVSGEGARTWHYVIKVTEKRKVQDRILGDVEVYLISERRTTSGRWSEREAQLSPANAELVSSIYRDSDGNKRECHIVALERPQ